MFGPGESDRSFACMPVYIAKCARVGLHSRAEVSRVRHMPHGGCGSCQNHINRVAQVHPSDVGKLHLTVTNEGSFFADFFFLSLIFGTVNVPI